MPLILAPYTLGAQLPAAPGGTAFGVGYWNRRKRFIAYIMSCLALVLLS